MNNKEIKVINYKKGHTLLYLKPGKTLDHLFLHMLFQKSRYSYLEKFASESRGRIKAT